VLSRAQSELLSSVILVVLVLLVGLSGFFLASSWSSQRYLESAFSSFADLSSSEFHGFLVSLENRSSALVVYAGVLRVGVIGDSLRVGVAVYNSSSAVQNWWLLEPVDPSYIGYNLSSVASAPGDLSFTPLASSPSSGLGAQSVYTRYSGSWASLGDLGYSGSVSVSWVGPVGPGQILFLNVSLSDRGARFLYIVVFTQFNDRYVASPVLVPLS